jgi:glycosyltransferase involved in cell wall biosynthesis
MESLVSILIPVFNAENWIEETIKSALDQEWKNIEIIIINDGSTDRTKQILSTYDKYKQIKIFHYNNEGVCSARNRALSKAKGDYIQWLDADDILDKRKIIEQMRILKNYSDPKILCSSAFGLFYFDVDDSKIVNNDLCSDLNPVDWLSTKLGNYNKNWVADSTWLVSRYLSIKAGPWNTSLIRDNDGEYFCRVVSNCTKVIFVKEAISYYRIGIPTSISQAKSDKALASLIFSSQLCIEHLLSIENSPRTRYSCTKLLEQQLYKCYPEYPHLIDRIHGIAKDLGQADIEPSESINFQLLRKIVGWKNAKALKLMLWNTRKSFDWHLAKFRYFVRTQISPKKWTPG